MPEYQVLNTTDFVTTLEKEAVTDFLMSSLGSYADNRDNISRAVEYALSKFPHQGGFIVLAREKDTIVGASIINRTNLEGYFAENILVFLATSEDSRGTGVGKELLRQTVLFTKGSILVRLNEFDDSQHFFKSAGFNQDFQGFVLSRD